MPIYEFDCKDCGSQFEELVKTYAAEKDVVCPGCGTAHVAKRFSAFSAVAASGGSAQADPYACSPTGCAKPSCGFMNN
jgi:putative FmdB family regulatory protein